MRRYLPLALFILLPLVGGTVIGALTQPGPWYAELEKPVFNPPGWVFGPIWSVLYVLIGFAGWRVWRTGAQPALTLWWVQLGINFLWSPVFFGANLIGAALAVIVAMLAAILAFIAAAWQRDRAAALAFLPYAAWVGFAMVLNGAIWAMN